MDISRELNEIIVAAYREAESRGHEYLTPEHVLYASLFFDRGRDIILSCGGNVEGLSTDLEGFFDAHMPVAEGGKPAQSAGFQSVMENAIMHTASADKESVEIDDILASIFEEKESFAAHFLTRQGIDRLTVLSFISHGVTEYPEEDTEPGPAEGGDPAEQEEPRSRGKQAKPLQAYAVDLTEKARSGGIDPLIGGGSSSSAPSRCSAGG
jgi:ATP-dependent Clp protease ATP-binding subunit ClpA